MANPFVKTKTTILFDGWVLMVNGAADFIFYFLLKRGLKASAEKQEEKREEEISEAAEDEKTVPEAQTLEADDKSAPEEETPEEVLEEWKD